MNSKTWTARVRRDDGPGRSEVGAIELFFDLVYVFAIVQLSHFLIHDLSWSGALRFVVLFGAIWWSWNYTAWAMNWLDPENWTVRLLNAVLMLAGFGMAVAVPEAFGDRAVLFTGCLIAAQIIRPVFMIVVHGGNIMRRNYAHLLAWSAVAATGWVVGAFVDEPARLWIWIAALAIDVAAPRFNFWVPGRGETPMSDWPTDAEHLAERNRLVFIIALGESILILGFTLTDMAEIDATTVTVALLGFVGLVVLWWGYFAVASNEVTTDGDVADTEILRSAFAYAHSLMVAGAIVMAVSIELRLTHEHLTTATVVASVAGPLLYLLGNAIYLRSRQSTIVASRGVAAAGLVVIGAIGIATVDDLAPILLGLSIVTVITVLVAYSQVRTTALDR